MINREESQLPHVYEHLTCTKARFHACLCVTLLASVQPPCFFCPLHPFSFPSLPLLAFPFSFLLLLTDHFSCKLFLITCTCDIDFTFSKSSPHIPVFSGCCTVVLSSVATEEGYLKAAKMFGIEIVVWLVLHLENYYEYT